ncbi:hypothetical protein O7599_32375 [Streptomyces sp. WMMC500]|uniref:hypothetical protein n=1 Tax=Streptomyces sp. WMMC500 TaxID=3015154 RepID=UPI00248B2802|nr:hypothetical protein [Streptomyces sp. WMMC500]WBB60174.1 hypothetical protein O7599_32375 [Streptomyces sp. WMMC500]
MPRRVSLPGADELFRTTGGTALQSSTPQSDRQRANGEAPGGSPRVPAPSREGDSEAVASGSEAESDADAEEAGAEDPGDSGGHGDGARGVRAGTGGNAGPAAPAGKRTAGAPAARRDPEATEHGGREASAEPAAGGRARQGEREPAAQARTKSARQSGGSAAAAQPRRGRGRGAARRPSGRERHDEKITVYVSAEELMDLEHARLVLRGDHGLAVDRGRIVREAVAVVLADLESRGDASILVRRLRGR